MAKQNFCVARVETRTRASVGKFERHIERKNESYENMNVDLSRTTMNVSFKGCGELTYNETLDQMIAEGRVSLKGLKADATVFNEMIMDVNFMNKRTRQYIGLLSAVIAYYLLHEGTHLLYALSIGAFKQINLMGLGMQIDIYAEKMTQTQLGVFCLLGSVTTLLIAYILIALIDKIKTISSKAVKACLYYITIAMLLIDPLYLSILCGFFGGGDMNGIKLLVPEAAARILYGLVLIVNVFVFVKIVLPKYKLAFTDEAQ